MSKPKKSLNPLKKESVGVANAVKTPLATKQSTLQKVLTAAVNDLGMEATFIGIRTHDQGPLIPQVARGFSGREIRAILRALWAEYGKGIDQNSPSSETDPYDLLRLRMVTPGSKVILAVPLKFGSRIYGTLVVGKRESATLPKREKTAIVRTGDHITDELKKSGLFGSPLILGSSMVAHEPASGDGESAQVPQLRTYTNSDVQERVASLLHDVEKSLDFERAWVTIYDPIVASLEILGGVGNQKRDLAPGHHLPIDESASGWAVRHRKHRCDHNLASTQGRFQDYKQLYKDRFASTLVVPFFVRGRVAGTVTLASKTPSQYDINEFDLAKVEPVTTRLVELFEDPSAKLSVLSEPDSSPERQADNLKSDTTETAIRREERRVALQEVSSFLATEIRDPMGFIRAQMEEITSEAHLDFDSQTRVETAMRDLMRIETLLNEVLDFAKPLTLDRRSCHIQALLDHALSLISTDLRVNRIEVNKDYPVRLAQVRWDEAKMQHAFLSIFKNSLEAMSPGGHLRVSVKLHRGRRNEVVIKIENDGVPIPPEVVDKVFEPYFTTKRSGTGLGLASVKKIVEEHNGHISIASRPEQGTTVTLRMPIPRQRVPYRGKQVVRRSRRTT